MIKLWFHHVNSHRQVTDGYQPYKFREWRFPLNDLCPEESKGLCNRHSLSVGAIHHFPCQDDFNMSTDWSIDSSSPENHCHSLHANASVNTLHIELITPDQTESLLDETGRCVWRRYAVVAPHNALKLSTYKPFKAPQCRSRQRGRQGWHAILKVRHNGRWPWGQHLRSFPKQTLTSRQWMTETWTRSVALQLCLTGN